MIKKETTLKFLAAGLAVLPADKSMKRPTIAWKNYQKHRSITADVERWWWSNFQSAILTVWEWS